MPESVTPSQAAESIIEPKPGGAIAPNYQYWRDHGAGWAAEYDQRKLNQVYYHIQELMLTEYIHHHAPARVLEVGCGPGRHLKNLVRLPPGAGIEAFGFDQSAAMVSGCLTWTDQAWIDRHVTLGPPTGRLPFEDGAFDIVYTAEVLVHVRPEDLAGMLRELCRVARRQVFHLETSPEHQLVSGEHDGCWWHDLPDAYAKINQRCEMLPSGYSTHAPYRVVLESSAKPWAWSPVFLDLCRRLERDITATLDAQRGSIAAEVERRENAEEATRSAAQREAASAAALAVREAAEARMADEIARLTRQAADELARERERVDAVTRDRDHALAQSAATLETEFLAHARTRDELAESRWEVRTLDEKVDQVEHELEATRLREQQGAERAGVTIAWQQFELGLIKKSRSYTLASRIRASVPMRAARSFTRAGTNSIRVVATGARNGSSKGNEVWLLEAFINAGEPAVPWDFIDRLRGWSERPEPSKPYGKCLIACRGELTVPAGANPELVFLCHDWSGKVRIEYDGRKEEIDLYSPNGGEVRVFPARSPMRVARTPSVATGNVDAPAVAVPMAAPEFTPTQEAFIRSVRAAKAQVVTVHCPRWLGVTNSTRNLFEHTLAVPESPLQEPYHLTDADLRSHARAIVECGARTVVFSGGDEAHFRLMQILRKAAPATRFLMLWHGNYVQFSDDYAFKTIQLWIDAAKAGHLDGIGTVKAGMDAYFRALGIPSKFVMNYIRGTHTPPQPPVIEGPAMQLGLWVSGTLWKTPNVMLAAAKLLPDARLHIAGVDVRTRDLIERMGLKTAFLSTSALPFDELMRRIRRTHLSMYVTFTECCPMIPLESFSQGVPCIIGPNNHLFEDDALLFERLVVPFPDRAEVIAKYARRACEERVEIVERYGRWVRSYNERARRSVEEFVGD